MEFPSRIYHWLLILTIIIGFAPSAAASSNCDPWAAKAVSVQGTVESRAAGAGSWQPIRLDDTFCPGDEIRVLDNSRASLALANESVLRLNANSAITVQEFRDNKTSLLDMFKGAGHFFSRRSNSLEVTTPYVVAGVRGTEFLIRVEDDQTFISIFEGGVLASNEAGEVNLAGGQSAIARKGQAPVLTTVVRPRDAVQWALYYPPVVYTPEKAAMAEDLENPAFLANRAANLLAVGNIDAAAADLEKALAIDPVFAEALSLQSIVALVKNDKENAYALAQKAVKANPKSSTAYIAMSYARQARFDMEGARRSLMDAVFASPDDALAHARLAEIQLSFGELDEALRSAQKATMLAPDLSRTQTVLGFAYLTQVKTDDARAAFEKAIQTDQADPLPRLGNGLAKIRDGHLEEGRAEIEVAASLDPNNSLIRSYLGKAFYEEKRSGLDEREFEIAKELDPNDPTPHFYSAIAKQTTNRPVEALQDMEKAIELNDNRAVYRSKLLLDSDLAARSASQARIYSDLGFQQRALVEGYNAVNTDPTNYSAHRFLADSYSVLPRHEIARVSELLQSQLLQPANLTPIQPSLAESNLFLISSSGAANTSFNEFNPLFNRNRTAVQASGMAGENSTWGGEGVVSGIYDKLSMSAGYSHFETDGWRVNADQEDDIANAFAQYEISNKTSIQGEYRYRNTKYGDVQLRFFEDDFLPNLRQEDEIDSFRLGFRHSFSPNSNLIGNFSYQDGERSLSDQPDPIVTFDDQVDDDGYGGELQYLHRSDRFSVLGGAGYFAIQREDVINTVITPPPIVIPPPFPGLPPIEIPIDPIFDTQTIDGDAEHTNVYLYSHVRMPQNILWTIGAGGDFYNSDSESSPDKDQFNPKLGVTWNPIPATTIRGAVFRVLKRTLITQQTLEPTQVAGFNQFYDEPNATDSWNYGAAIDQKISDTVFAGAEYIYRDLNVPWLNLNAPTPTIEDGDWEEQRLRAYIYWTPLNWFSVTGEYLWEKFERDEERADGVKDVKTNYFPIGINFFHPSGLGAMLKGTYVDQRGSFERQGSLGTFEDGEDDFWLMDAAISYRLPKRYGIFSVGVNNMFDEEFKYFDTDRNNPRLQPGRFFFARVTLAIP